MKLPDILAYVMNTTQVLVITRSSSPKRYQIRFTPTRDPKFRDREPKGIQIEGRRWMADDRLSPFDGWSRWATFLGFSVAGVLANDWEFVKEEFVKEEAS